MAQDRNRWRALVNAVMNLWVSLYAWDFLSSLETVSFSGRHLPRGVSLFMDRQITLVTHFAKMC